MHRTGRLALLVSVLAGGCSSNPGETAVEARDLVEAAATALGGRARLLALKSVVVEGTGWTGNLGQDVTPESAGQTFTITDYRRVLSFSADALRTEQTRTPAFPYFQGQNPLKQLMGVDGDIGYNISPLGVAVRVSDAATRQRRIDMFHHPVALVRAALAPEARLANARTEGTESILDVTTASGVTLTLGIDGATRLPTRISSQSYDPNLGDVTLETGFGDYREVSGVKVPWRVTTKTDHWTTSEMILSAADVDGIVGDMAAPEDAVASRPASAAPEPVVDDIELAPGVWLMAGQSHHSVIVELADELLLIEAPQHEARTLAVIRRARELRPGKPLARVVNTHHHFDHSAGIRAAVSEGLAIVTHEGNAAFFQEIVKRPHRRNPDALDRRPRGLTIQPVGDRLEIADAARTIHLFHVAGSPHSATMLMVYLPEQRLLIEADAFTPGAVAPFAANLLDNIERRGLKVERIVPLHGSPAPFDALRKAVRTPVGTQD